MFSLLYGMCNYFFSKAEYSIPLLGLDGAGKTTLTEKIKSIYTGAPPPINITPTIGLNVRRVELGNVKLRLWDLSGEEGMRKIWPNYYSHADGLIFCIDGTNPDRLEESRQAFESVVSSGILKNMPLLVFINKSDKFDTSSSSPSISINQIREYFQIEKLQPHTIKQFKVVTGSAVDGGGVKIGIEWLGEYLHQHVESKENRF